MRSFGKRNPLNKQDFAEFEQLYQAEMRKATYDKESNPNGRWREFSIDEIKARPNTNLDISWMTDNDEADNRTLQELLGEMKDQSDAIATAVKQLEHLLGDVADE